MADDATLELFNEFKRAAEETEPADAARADALLSRLKARLLVASSTAEQLLLRETLETALLMDARRGDGDAFARHYAQLRPLHALATLPPSARALLATGLNLTRLLAQNRIADFHTELERVPHAVRGADRFVRFPVELEQLMAEGNYGRVLRARAQPPAECFAPFVATLAATVRDDIADCSERAYASLPLDAARRSLLFADDADGFAAYAGARSWMIRDGRVFFPAQQQQSAAADDDVPAHRLIHATLGYCRELERIV